MAPKKVSMSRKKKKVTMEHIVKDSTRKSTCKKRTMGMVKKASELSILCGVKACVIVFPEGGESSQSQTHVWPSLPEATSIIDHFKSMPEADQRRRNMDGEGYIRERARKIQEQLRKAERDNRQREATLLIHDAMVGRRPSLDGLTVEQLIGVGWTTENLIKKIKHVIACRGGQQTGVEKDDPLPYAATVAADLEAPHLQQRGWVMDVLKAGWNLDAMACSGGSGRYGGAGAGGDVMQLGSTAGGSDADPGACFRPV